ncbi:hypothetical protein INR49_000470 [Caranx melampygus]|nr:hypothetical protein INR49_000470 [Caranx melampygus]
MCAAGSRVEADCTEFRSTSCLPCIDGTFVINQLDLNMFYLHKVLSRLWSENKEFMYNNI